MKSESVQDKNFVQLCYCHRKSCLAPHFSSFFSWSKMIERSSKMVQKSWQELRSTVIVCLFPTICLVPTFSSDSASRFSTVCQNIIFRSKIQYDENTYKKVNLILYCQNWLFLFQFSRFLKWSKNLTKICVLTQCASYRKTFCWYFGLIHFV